LFFLDGNRIISYSVEKKILTDKHILRKKKYDEEEIVGLRRDLELADEDFARITAGDGEKIQDTDIMDDIDRTLTFSKNEATTKEKEYKNKNEEFRDHVSNTAQYVKFVNAHLAAKQSKLMELKKRSEDFEKEVAKLKPTDQRIKSDLDLVNYNEITSDDIRIVLFDLKKDRDEASAKVEHFSTKLSHANEELEKKNSEMENVKSKLIAIKNKESSQKNETKIEDNVMGTIHNELSSLDSKGETGKIYGAINSLVVLLNSKNQETLNELNSIKSEFNNMKKEYDKTIQKLNKKK